MVYSILFFFVLQNAVCFIILTYLVPVLFTSYIQSVLKIIPAPKVNTESFHNTCNKYLFSYTRLPSFVMTYSRTSCETNYQETFRVICCFLTDPASAVNISRASNPVH